MNASQESAERVAFELDLEWYARATGSGADGAETDTYPEAPIEPAYYAAVEAAIETYRERKRAMALAAGF
jgi:hypothetical protein